MRHWLPVPCLWCHKSGETDFCFVIFHSWIRSSRCVFYSDLAPQETKLAACSFWGWPSQKKSRVSRFKNGCKILQSDAMLLANLRADSGWLPHFCCVPCLLLETPPQLTIRSLNVSATFTFGMKSVCSVDRDFLLLTDIYKSFIWSSCHRGIDEMIVVCGKHVVWHISWELMDMCSSVCTNMHMLFYLWGIKTLIAAIPVVRLFLVPAELRYKGPFVVWNWTGWTWLQ